MCVLGLFSVLKSQIHPFYPDIGDLIWKQLFNQFIVPRIQTTQQKCFRILFCRIEPFGLFCKLQIFQPNHFVPLLRLFKYSLESKCTRSMGAKRVHVSVHLVLNSIGWKLPNQLPFYVIAVTLLLVIHFLPPLFIYNFF